MHTLVQASNTYDIQEFLELAFPTEWEGISARILETGVTMSKEPCKWAPRWSKIPPTIRSGNDGLETAAKSVIFRVHDCLHQLWGLPHPGNFSEEDFYYYKRGQMCGEVAVLTLAEFVYCKYLSEEYPELLPLLYSRNALPLLKGPLVNKTTEEIAIRLDGLLHKKIRPRWVRRNQYAEAFVDDYVPMLEKDRQQIDINWEAMKASGFNPGNAPQAKFDKHMDGLELTVWMIRDFNHLLSSHPEPDWGLVKFNRERRNKIVLPEGWVS